MSSLPEGWSKRESNSHPGKYYYVHKDGETTWDLPTSTKIPVSGAVAPEEVRVLHILRKHNRSRRPSSWRVEKIEQSKEAAIGQIEDFRSQIVRCGAEQGYSAMRKMFGDIAHTESDCSSAQKYGDLGSFGRGAMQKPFEVASFALNIGDVSGLVDTDSGIHIILRIA